MKPRSSNHGGSRSFAYLSHRLRARPGAVVLELKASAVPLDGVSNVSLTVCTGEILGLAGLVECRTNRTGARVVSGLRPQTQEK